MKTLNLFSGLLFVVVASEARLLAAVKYEPYTFTTIAGASGKSGSEDGASARFKTPVGIVIDDLGNLYVGDIGNHTIRMLKPSGSNWVVTTIAGTVGVSGTIDGEAGVARLFEPAPTTIDHEGNLYCSIYNQHVLRKLTREGTSWVVSTIGVPRRPGAADGTNGIARFNFPSAVVADRVGNLYVSDSENHLIRRVTQQGTNYNVTTIAGLVANPGHANGIGKTARFAGPNHITIDHLGNLFVIDLYSSLVRKLSPKGEEWEVSTIAGRPGAFGNADGLGAAAQFGQMNCIAADKTGNLYVAEQNTLRKLTLVGTNWHVTTLAGRYGSAAPVNGTGSAAKFVALSTIILDKDGNVYACDSGDHTIRKGIPNPVLSSSGPAFGFRGGPFGFEFVAQSNRVVVVQSSPDLASWASVWTNSPAEASRFSDPQDKASDRRFFRALMR